MWMRRGDRRTARMVTVVVLGAALLAGCGGGGGGADPAGAPQAKAPRTGGPFFGTCGGVDVADVAAATGLIGLHRTVKNPSSCQWVNAAGARISFDWFRRSPIGRERAAVQLSKDRVEEVTILGHRGFTGVSHNVCEVIIGFDADFIEWLVTTDRPRATDDAKEFCTAATALAQLSIERAQR